MYRPLLIAGFVVASLGPTGCQGTWDTVTSRRFRDHPFVTTQRMWSPEDPVAVLRADPPRDGDERAAAMHRLQEPSRNKGTQEDQDAIIALLAQAATADSSPVMRMEAIGALGRFEDSRAASILMTAYQNANGLRDGDKPAAQAKVHTDIIQTGASAGRTPTRIPIEGYSLTGPKGYSPEWVTAIRCRAAESLGRTNRPEAAQFLATIAGGAGKDIVQDGSDEREVRLAAVRGLGKCRQPEAVAALAQVLNVEAEKKDTAIIDRTHEGLVRLTGKKLPPDPQEWNRVVQAGIVIAPEPTWFDTAIDTAMFWQK